MTTGVTFTAYQKNEIKEEVTTKICERWLLSQFDSLKKGSAKYKNILDSKECKFRENATWCYQTLHQDLEACIAELRHSAPLWKIKTFNYGGEKTTQITKIAFDRGSFELTDDSVLESDKTQTRKILREKLESYIRSIELERKKLTKDLLKQRYDSPPGTSSSSTTNATTDNSDNSSVVTTTNQHKQRYDSPPDTSSSSITNATTSDNSDNSSPVTTTNQPTMISTSSLLTKDLLKQRKKTLFLMIRLFLLLQMLLLLLLLLLTTVITQSPKSSWKHFSLFLKKQFSLMIYMIASMYGSNTIILLLTRMIINTDLWLWNWYSVWSISSWHSWRLSP